MPHKKSHKVRRSKKSGRKTMKVRRGGSYGFSGAVSTGAPNWVAGHEVPVKGGKRSRKVGSRRRKMRGGSSFGTVTGASFKGTGVAGTADYSPYNAGFSNDAIPT